MTCRVVFTPGAEDHLDELYRYIALAATPNITAGYVDGEIQKVLSWSVSRQSVGLAL